MQATTKPSIGSIVNKTSEMIKTIVSDYKSGNGRPDKITERADEFLKELEKISAEEKSEAAAAEFGRSMYDVIDNFLADSPRSIMEGLRDILTYAIWSEDYQDTDKNTKEWHTACVFKISDLINCLDNLYKIVSPPVAEGCSQWDILLYEAHRPIGGRLLNPQKDRPF